MNTCQNDQGECLRPTPETENVVGHKNDVYKFVPDHGWDWVVPADFGRRLERQRNEAREAFVIATDQLVQVQGELRRMRDELNRLRKELE